MAKGADRELLRRIYIRMRNGMTTTDIGKELGMQQSVVSRLAQKKHMETALSMMSMADEGYTLEEIGKQFGVTKQRVAQLIGVQRKVGSTGKMVQIDAAPESWAALMASLEALDIPVRSARGVDTRAIAVFLDGLLTGEYGVTRRRVRTLGSVVADSP